MARAARNRSKTAAKKRQRTSPAPKRGASTPWPTIEEFLASEEGEKAMQVLEKIHLRAWDIWKRTALKDVARQA